MTQTQINGATQVQAGTITTVQLSASAALTDGQLATSYIKTDGSRAHTGDQSMGSHNLTSVANGTAADHAVNLSQLQAAIRDQDHKASVAFASTGSESYTISAGSVTQISGTTFGGGSPAVNDRILIKNAPSATGSGTADSGTTGTNQAPNGLYLVTNATTNLTVSRSTDADGNSEVTTGATTWVDQGTLEDTQWTLITNPTITVGTTTLQFTKTGGATVSADGTSIVQSGNTFVRGALTGDVTASQGSNSTTIAANVVTLAKMATLATGKIIGNLSGSTATPIATDAVATATASTVVARDSNANIKNNSTASGVATTASAAGTTTLTVGSAQFQQITGSTTQTVVLPDATTLVTGQSFIISNQSSGAVQVNANGGGGVRTVAALTSATITLIAAGSAAGTWDAGTTAAATGLTTSNFVTRETPSGSINGSNVTFTLANTPTSGTEEVFLNGILQEPGAGNDYTISSGTITYLTAPVSGDRLRVSYRK